MIKTIKVTNLQSFAASVIPKQPQKNKKIVESILNNVKKNGDKSIRQYEKKFSGATISSLRVSEDEIKSAFSVVSKSEISAIRLAKSRVQKTESALKSLLKNKNINHDGIKISKKFIPITSVG